MPKLTTYKTLRNLFKAANRMIQRLDEQGISTAEVEQQVKPEFDSIERQLIDWNQTVRTRLETSLSHEMVSRMNHAWFQAMSQPIASQTTPIASQTTPIASQSKE